MLFNFIINGFLNIVDYFINLLPAVNSGIDWTSNVWVTFNNAIFDNIGLVDIFVPMNYFFAVFIATVSILLAKWLFQLVMFALRKIPLASLD